MTSFNPSILHQETMTKNHKSHSRAKQEQQLEDHAALLMDDIFNVIPGTVNMQHGTVSMPIVGSSHGQRVMSPAVRLGSISSMPHLVPQPVSF